MSKAQTFTEALSVYLSGAEWQHSIDIFVRNNCDQFYEVTADAYGHDHHTLWKTYQDIVENILEMALQNAGGSLESLEKALDEVSSVPSRGPKDDAVKEILAKLMTFNDFDSFAKMMTDVAEDIAKNGHHNSSNPYHHELHRNRNGAHAAVTHLSDNEEGADVNYSGGGSDHRDTLLVLGFEADLVDMVLAGSDKDTDLEQLVMVLSEMQASEESSKSKEKSKQTNINRLLGVEPSSASPVKANIVQNPEQMPHMRKFADACGPNVGDWNELNARFVTARSLLDTFIDGDVSHEVVVMVQWASDMVELYEAIEKAYARGQSMKDPTDKRPQTSQSGLVGWYFELEETRKELQMSREASALLSDNEIARMAALDRIAEMGTSDEQLLHKMITRHDEVQKDINLLHRRCGALCAPGSGIKRETVEELYLYLKDKVAGNADLSSVADEMHEHVYTLVDGAKGGEIINVLLEMHALEDEQSILRQKIDSLLGSPAHRSESKDVNNSNDMFGNSSAVRNVQSKDTEGLESGGYSLHEAKADFKSGPFISGKRGAASRDEDMNEEALQAHVNNLKHKHKQTLEALRAALDNDKNRKMQALEERLLRRKRAGEKELASARASGASEAELTTLNAQLHAAEAEIEKEIEGTEAHYKALSEGVCGGFKKRCIYEIKATQARGQALTKEETDDSHKEAAEALKSRFFRDNKQLQESLEHERANSRKKILATLEKRKRDARGDPDTLKTIEQEAKQVLEDMAFDYVDQERNALAGPQEAALLGLSGIFANVDSIIGTTGKTKKHAEDDGDFFDDDVADAGASAWVDGISSMRDVYIDAGRALKAKIRVAYQQGEVAEGEEEGFGAITQHMTQVITNAYTTQLRDSDAMSKMLKNSGSAVDADRVKASILEEFEKSRDAYEEALDHAREQSKANLEKRKGRLQQGNNGSGSGAKQASDDSEWGTENIRIRKTQAALEQVVDNFLEDPIVITRGMRNPSVSVYAAKFDPKTSAHHSQRKAEREARAEAKAQSSAPVDNQADVKSKADEAREKAEILQAKEEQNLRLQKDNIKDKAQAREKELIDALTVEMQKKKHRLEERLRRKKEERCGDRDADEMFGVESELDEDEIRTQKELDGIDEAFEKAVTLLKRADEARLNTVSVAQLMDVVDRLSKRKEDSSIEAAFHDTQENGNRSVEAKMEDDAFQSWEPAVSHTAQAIEARHAMENEVTRISETYNEEKQKLDLMMKIQQARQKQMLQRKLLDRKQGQGIAQGMLRGAGFSSDTPLPAMATGGLGRQLPPIQGGFRGLAAAGTMGLNETTSPSKDVLARGMSINQILRK